MCLVVQLVVAYIPCKASAHPLRDHYESHKPGVLEYQGVILIYMLYVHTLIYMYMCHGSPCVYARWCARQVMRIPC